MWKVSEFDYVIQSLVIELEQCAKRASLGIISLRGLFQTPVSKRSTLMRFKQTLHELSERIRMFLLILRQASIRTAPLI